MSSLLPWHHAHWQKLLERLRAGRLPHAILLAGPAGLGKVQFAAYLVGTLLCQTGAAAGRPCGQCRSCLLFAAHNHPDLRLVRPLEEGKKIVVDQIREISHYLAQTAQFGGYKAVIIAPAELMNINAANSLLKTLEEPSGNTVLILVSAQPGRLPATILSRCQQLAFTPPNAEEGRHWLADRTGGDTDLDLLLTLAEGAPLRALEMAESNVLPRRREVMRSLQVLLKGEETPTAVAEQLLKVGVQQTLNWLYNWVADMIRYRACGGEGSRFLNQDMREQLLSCASRADSLAMHRYLQQVNQAMYLSGGQTNPQLLLEDILMAWQETFASTARKPERR